MHFAIGSCNASIRIDDNGRVVVNALGPLFKKGNNQYNLQLFGQLRECFARWAGQGFGQGKILGVFSLAKILS